MDQDTLLLLAIITLIIIGVFSGILNYWMWSQWKRTMGITKKIEDEEILEPVTMGEPTEPAAVEPAPEPGPAPESAPEPEPAPEEPRSEY
jgi:hypothetical protein